MNFSQEQIEKIISYISNEKFKKLCIDLGICSENTTEQELLDGIKKYIQEDMMGKFRGNSAINKFFNSIEIYLENNDFYQDDKGYIDYNYILPIANSKQRDGLRAQNDILGNDRKKYVVKEAEGYKGAISGFKYARDAKYNPTMGYAFFNYLKQPCARNLMAYERFPYYYIFSENFLKENELMYGLDDLEFITTSFIIDENNNITHRQILEGIKETIKSKGLPESKSLALCKKVELQYAIQETLKCLICVADENLGNTALIVKQGENGEIEDINISPAYDLDLSFNIGEEMLKGIPQSMITYRTTKDGKTDLQAIIAEFKDIEGYKEAMQAIQNKFNGSYINEIFDIAYQEAKVDVFNEKEFRDRFGSFIMRRVASFKEALKETANKDKLKN